jgi:hypothetical protein
MYNTSNCLSNSSKKALTCQVYGIITGLSDISASIEDMGELTWAVAEE